MESNCRALDKNIVEPRSPVQQMLEASDGWQGGAPPHKVSYSRPGSFLYATISARLPPFHIKSLRERSLQASEREVNHTLVQIDFCGLLSAYLKHNPIWEKISRQQSVQSVQFQGHKKAEGATI